MKRERGGIHRVVSASELIDKTNWTSWWKNSQSSASAVVWKEKRGSKAGVKRGPYKKKVVPMKDDKSIMKDDIEWQKAYPF